MVETTGGMQGDCPRCGVMARLRPRTFSDQAMAALLAWGELEEAQVGKPLCDHCYGELREVLIDRVDELADAAATGKPPAPVKAPAPAKAPAAAKPSAPVKAVPAAKATPAAKTPPAKKGKGVKRAG